MGIGSKIPAAGPSSLPAARGPESEALIGYLTGAARTLHAEPVIPVDSPSADDDLQLALYVCYELHYRGFEGVGDELEWDPEVLRFRAGLERAFAAELEAGAALDMTVEPGDIGDALFELAAADDGPSLARHLEIRGTLEQFREFLMHRSAYQLKEADPHSWGIPRLEGAAKSALVEVQADEYGSGDPERMHSRLFAKVMAALDLDPGYGGYLDRLPGTTLATVNLISYFGLHRRLRGALVGHLAMFEISSAQPNRRYGNALRRLGFSKDATDFFDEHVEADSVHENVAAYDLAQALAESEPGLAPDIMFGARALLRLDAAMAESMLAAWDEGRSSLRPAQSAPSSRETTLAGSPSA